MVTGKGFQVAGSFCLGHADCGPRLDCIANRCSLRAFPPLCNCSPMEICRNGFCIPNSRMNLLLFLYLRRSPSLCLLLSSNLTLSLSLHLSLFLSIYPFLSLSFSRKSRLRFCFLIMMVKFLRLFYCTLSSGSFLPAWQLRSR